MGGAGPGEEGCRGVPRIALSVGGRVSRLRSGPRPHRCPFLWPMWFSVFFFCFKPKGEPRLRSWEIRWQEGIEGSHGLLGFLFQFPPHPHPRGGREARGIKGSGGGQGQGDRGARWALKSGLHRGLGPAFRAGGGGRRWLARRRRCGSPETLNLAPFLRPAQSPLRSPLKTMQTPSPEPRARRPRRP